jgi:hypothetical protein
MNPQGFVSIHTLLVSTIPISLCLTGRPWQGCGRCGSTIYLACGSRFAARSSHYSGISIGVSIVFNRLQLPPRHRLFNVAIFFQGHQPASHACMHFPHVDLALHATSTLITALWRLDEAA